MSLKKRSLAMFKHKIDASQGNGESKVNKFWNSLDYWEAVNLLTTIIKATNPNISSEDAYSEAIATYSDEAKSLYLIDQTIHSWIH